MAHKSQDKLAEDLEKAKAHIAIGGIYVHFKSPEMRYEVQGLAIDAGTTEVLVIYRALYDQGVVFARPLSEWLDEVEFEGKRMKRFTLS